MSLWHITLCLIFFSTQHYLNRVHIGTQIPDSFILIAIHYVVESVYLMEVSIPYQEMLTLPSISYSSNGTNTNTNARMSMFPHIFLQEHDFLWDTHQEGGFLDRVHYIFTFARFCQMGLQSDIKDCLE